MDTEVLRKIPTIQQFFNISETGEMPEGVRLFLSSMQEVIIPSGHDIVTFGADCSDGMYIIISGTCNVFSEDGHEISQPLGTGDFIGELGLMNDQPRGATVRAATDVICANISKSLFDHIGSLDKTIYGSFMTMLYNRTSHMVAEQERIRTELAVATSIQDGILEHDFSSFNELSDINLYASIRPAKEMAGDFYDVFMVDDDKLCFVIADVAGKGIPAAMFMMMAKIHIKNYTSLGLPLDEVAKRVNKQLCYKNEASMFVTVFLCVLNLKTNELQFINAGHNKPFISKSGDKFTMIPAKVNFVFGLMEDIPYTVQSLTLAPGDCFYMYTDGVSEAVDENEELFGDERLEDSLNSILSLADAPLPFVDRMFDIIDDYAGYADQADDITMIYISRR